MRFFLGRYFLRKRYLMGVLTVLLFDITAHSQKKMDLEDLSIKGELHSDDRLKLLARENSKIKNFVKYRTNYRSEIIEGLRKPKPKYKYFDLDRYKR